MNFLQDRQGMQSTMQKATSHSPIKIQKGSFSLLNIYHYW